MRPKFFTIMFFTFLILCCSVVVRAELQNQWYGGQRVVYDATNDVYFYPLLSNMLQMTKAQQQEFIDQLNAEAYATVTDWQFANLEQMKALGLSICENATQIMGDDTWDGPKQFTPIHLEQFFEFTQYFPAPAPGAPPFPPEHYLTMGRTADEVGALIEVPNDVNYIGELVYSDPNSTTSTYRTIEGQPSQGQYHFPQLFNPETGELDTLMFDGDINYVADNATTSPMMGMNQECSAWVVSTEGPAQATQDNLSVELLSGDKVVYDAKNNTYWYPLLTNMLQMTKTEQQEYIDQLNVEAYGGIMDWQFANLEQMKALGLSICENATQIMGDDTWDGPKQFTPIHLEQFFEFTQYFPAPAPGAPPFPPEHYLTMGRTADEVGALIEVPNDVNYIGELVYSDPNSTTSTYRTIEGQPSQGQYHFPQLFNPATGELDTLMFDGDLNYVADDATTSPMMGMNQECSAWVVSTKGPAEAAPLENQFYDSDRVVYDPANDLYWYPFLTDTVNMTRAEQEEFIVGLNAEGYANIKSWQMATYDQVQVLKDSLAGMGTTRIEYEWPWTPPGSPRQIGSPFLAWPVQVDQFFTPTAEANLPPQVFEGVPAQTYNGRTAGWGWRNDGTPGQPDDVDWRYGEADDHFGVLGYMTPGEFATMVFNYDQHYLPDDATVSLAVGGPVGAWIVSEKRPPLENQFYDGDRVVYDPTTNLYWYPSLTDTVNMTRAEQEEFIVGLNAKGYANINTWEMATWKQTTALKWSLAKMATECILPTGFGPDFGTPVLVDRGVTSPYMAWEVDSLEYFTPTAFTPDELLPPMVQPSGGTYMFNGRTADDAWGWRNDGEPGQPDDVEWRLGDAADHWVAHSYKTGMDGDGLTMMFNIDQHYLPDDGTDHGMLGPVGTWIVSEKELNKN